LSNFCLSANLVSRTFRTLSSIFKESWVFDLLTPRTFCLASADQILAFAWQMA
jgi:hypothetical protein